MWDPPIFQRLEKLNLNAITPQQLKKMNQEQLDELKRREMKILEAFNTLRNMLNEHRD